MRSRIGFRADAGWRIADDICEVFEAVKSGERKTRDVAVYSHLSNPLRARPGAHSLVANHLD